MNEADEWLETDGLGGFAMGTASGVRTRRYHALLCAAAQPPSGRQVLVSGFDAFAGELAISSQRYAPDHLHPDGVARLVEFRHQPWPTWIWDLGDARVTQEIVSGHGAPVVVVRWRLEGAARTLRVRPFLAGRDFHALVRENGDVGLHADEDGERLRFRLYPGILPLTMLHTGRYFAEPDWYRQFDYAEERARGLDHVEDLATPGWLQFELAAGNDAFWLCAAGDGPASDARTAGELVLARESARRAGLGGPLARAADHYLVARGAGRTIIAGYPWFGDWGRDTFIALRGLCLATGRRDDARAILVEWAGAASGGLVPNRFPDRGEAPEYNSVDAALWYVIAADEWLRGGEVGGDDRARVERAIDAVVEGYRRGCRYGIRVDADGLVAAGAPGVQLTWMDAKVGDWVVTPRHGKPVEIQALWLNALAIAARRRPELQADLARGLASFTARFWNEPAGALLDVVDVDGLAGAVDASLRPNQLLAVGGLPLALVEGERARRIVAWAEKALWTPLGPRSLAPGSEGYVGRYEGGVLQRDGAYHQGTVWPWLAGAFVDAWLRVGGSREEAIRRFLAPLREHLGHAGLGHVSEIADGDPPHTPRGCPFQAWSVGELIRIEQRLMST